jgi:FkbM family methyltransferase
MIAFRRKLGRGAFLREAAALVARSVLQRQTDRHLAAGRRQLAVFSFDAVSHSINWDGLYERDELDTLFAWLRELGVDTASAAAIDIGAYIGNHTLYFADRFKSVVSFEPNPRAHALLRLNASLVRNVTCHEVGLSDREGEAILCVTPGNMGAAYIADAPAGETHRIRLAALDAMHLHDDVKLVKVDVEGHELQALRGAQALLRRNQPIVLFEQHAADFKQGRSAVVAFLQELGYSRFATIRRHPRVSGGFATRALLLPLVRTLAGESIEIRVEESIVPGFYSSLVALPAWLSTD